MKFCDASGKQCHATKAGAGAQLGHLKRHRGDPKRFKIATYQCRHCGCWHVGHQAGAGSVRREEGIGHGRNTEGTDQGMESGRGSTLMNADQKGAG